MREGEKFTLRRRGKLCWASLKVRGEEDTWKMRAEGRETDFVWQRGRLQLLMRERERGGK
jgi:hypothetical protein